MTRALFLTFAFAIFSLPTEKALAMGATLPEESSYSNTNWSARQASVVDGRFRYPRNREVDLSQYDHVDPHRIVPTRPLQQAIEFYHVNRSQLRNTRYITVIDMTRHSSQQRYFLVDMQTGRVNSYYTSHGSGSDPRNTGFVQQFSNQRGSHATSKGFYLTANRYHGSNGLSMRLHGLETTNSNAFRRAVVMHGADYVRPGAVGRSWGCPAVERRHTAPLIDRTENGSLMYIWGGQ